MTHRPGLYSLRALAIIRVILFHSWIVGGLDGSIQWLGNVGWMGKW